MKELNELIESYLLNNTFNNIQILLTNREILKLDEDSLDKKIEREKKGGYCFEHNQHFFNLLKRADYKVQRVLGRVVYGDNKAEPPRTHQASLVSLESGNYIVDVGFGPYTPGVAVPVSGEEVKAINGNIYRIVKLNSMDFQLEVKRGEEYFSLYQFNLVKYVDADFKLANYYTNTHNDSKFVKSLILSQLTNAGVKFLNNFIFTKMNGAEREDFEMTNRDELYKVIEDNFDISMTQDETNKLYDIIDKIIRIGG